MTDIEKYVALAEKCGAEVGRYEGQMVWMKFHRPSSLEEFATGIAMQAREQSAKLAYALEQLLSDTQHAKHESCTDGGYCPVRDAREALEGFRRGEPHPPWCSGGCCDRSEEAK